MTARHLNLRLPGLRLHPGSQALPGRLSALETLLVRASRLPATAGHEAGLLALFDIRPGMYEELPVAALTHLADRGELPSGPCLRADPVHLVPDRDELVLLGAADLALDADEARRLCDELNAVYAEDSWHFEAPVPERWYLHLPQRPRLRTWPPSAVEGLPIGQRLPAGEQGRDWHRVMNEVQMLLHGSAVNRRRAEEGRPTVSSLWFWGGGELPASLPEPCLSRVFGDDPLLAGLARHRGVTLDAAPADARAWLAGLGPREAWREEVLCLDVLDRARREGGEVWWAALQGLERDWIAPLVDALRGGRLDSLMLDDTEGRWFRLTRASLWRWWRRRRPLERLLT